MPNGLWSRPVVTLPFVTMQHNGEGATIEMVRNAARSSCEIIVHDMKDARIAERANSLGIHSVPAVVIEGRLVGSGRGVDEQALRAAGLGQPL